MSNKIKKLVAVSLAMSLVCGMSSFYTFADEEKSDAAQTEITETAEIVTSEEAVEKKPQKVVFSADEPDKDGYFTIKMTLYDAKLLATQFGVTYDPEVVMPVNIETGKEAEEFEDFRTLYEYEADGKTFSFSEILSNAGLMKEKNAFSYTAFYIPSGSTKYIEIGEEGFTLYEFRFKKLKNGDPKFDLMDYNGDVDKLAYVLSGEDYEDVEVVFDIDESFGTKDELTYNIELSKIETREYEYSEKELRDMRIKNTVYLNINNYAAAIDGALTWIDADNKSVVPYIEDDRTFVPLRFISEAMGAEVGWDEATGGITLKNGENTVSVTIGSKAYTAGEESGEMDVSPVIREDRTFVPVRFVSEALGKAVYWDEATKSVIITPKDKPWDAENSIEKNLLSDLMLITSPLVRDFYEPTETAE